MHLKLDRSLGITAMILLTPDQLRYMIDLLHTKLMLIRSQLQTWQILLERWSCQLLQKVWFKFILEAAIPQLRLTSWLSLLLLSITLRLTTLMLEVFVFWALITATTDNPLVLFPAAPPMLTQKSFQPSHGQRLSILNFNTHSPTSSTRIEPRRIDASQ